MKVLLTSISIIFSPTTFKNGNIYNETTQNDGSCEIFSLARKLNLSQEQTLHLLKIFYRKDILEYPEKDDHQNIRNFIKFGWTDIQI